MYYYFQVIHCSVNYLLSSSFFLLRVPLPFPFFIPFLSLLSIVHYTVFPLSPSFFQNTLSITRFIQTSFVATQHANSLRKVLLPLGRPRRRWEDNIKKDLEEVGGGCGDWMERAQDRDSWRALVSTVMNFRVP
jgi:hypothetical protein